MASFESIQNSIRPELDRLNELIRISLSSDNALMQQVTERYLRTSGKQVRPMMVLLSAKLFGEVNHDAMLSAAAVELLHNASLIHDDVVDNSKMRRNSPTVNAIWDNHVAVLVGDFFLSTAMLKANETRNIAIIDLLSALGKQLSLGELEQIYNAHTHTISEEAYFSVIRQKTASLFVTCANMGCLAAGVGEAETAAVASFAELFGLCFQIRDDIFDYFTDGKVGKPTGNDLREGKMTLPLIHSLISHKDTQNKEMLALASKEPLSDDEISILTGYAVATGGIDYAYDTMARLRDEARSCLAPLPDSPAKSAMLSLLDLIISRDY